jgi:hypothetical protein
LGAETHFEPVFFCLVRVVLVGDVDRVFRKRKTKGLEPKNKTLWCGQFF